MTEETMTTPNEDQRAMTEFERELADDAARIAKRIQGRGWAPLVTLIVRPPCGSGERDALVTTDEPESVVAAIRRITGGSAGLAALDVVDSMTVSKPPTPTTVEEARGEAMGFVLAVIDMANALEPPAGTSARNALVQWSVMVERVAHEQFGADWSKFVEQARSLDAKRRPN